MLVALSRTKLDLVNDRDDTYLGALSRRTDGQGDRDAISVALRHFSMGGGETKFF